MNNSPTTNEESIRNALDDIARNFQPSTRQRFAPLLPYKNQVLELRGQKASFKTIAKLLKRFSVQTTGETVRRFYHIVIEQKPTKRKRNRRNEKRQMKKRSVKPKLPRPLSPPSTAQPRIARIEDL
jgi:hypothetical protein